MRLVRIILEKKRGALKNEMPVAKWPEKAERLHTKGLRAEARQKSKRVPKKSSTLLLMHRRTA